MEEAWLLPAVPACAFVILALFHGYLPRRGDFIAIGAAIASFVMFLMVAVDLIDQLPVFAHDLQNNTSGFDWVEIPEVDFLLRIGFRVDQITVVMLSAVTLVGMLVQIYSVGYMKGEPRYGWYYAVLSLFIASMMTLVLADNFLLLYITWEGVGICSYLLIGHYYERRSAAEAAKKAFITTRIGDVFLLIGIVLLWREAGTFDMSEIFAMAEEGGFDKGYLTMATLFLFGGAMGKSAQFPFHVWLPDAMEGPTPVSALIHAATMVNAGVYFVARTSPLFAQAPETLIIVASIGIFTAILAASIALTQTDIKRVLAYSTLSQLGYMFAALGVGAFVAAIFHLMAHGFTKGLLFLGSGSVIHAVHDEQDMRRMGGLWRRIPITHWTFLIGALSLAGIPPLAGFFSKDSVLGESFVLDFQWVFIIGVIVAGLTGFYMFRLMGLTFYGKSRVDPAVEPNIHESPPSMTVPLILLAVPTILLGLVIGLPLGDSPIMHWLEPVFHPAEETLLIELPEYELFGIDGALIIISVAIAAIGIGVGIWLFGFFRREGQPETVRRLTARNGATRFLYGASFHKWWFDDLNDLVFYRFGGAVANGVMWFDVRVIDGIVNGIATGTQALGDGARRIQTGRVQNYALGIALGLIAIALLFIWLAR